MSTPNRLELHPEDVLTISFVGPRYAWSEALLRFDCGVHELAEHEAWQIAEAFDRDTHGGHAMFPLLDPRSDLFARLLAFREAIV